MLLKGSTLLLQELGPRKLQAEPTTAGGESKVLLLNSVKYAPEHFSKKRPDDFSKGSPDDLSKGSPDDFSENCPDDF